MSTLDTVTVDRGLRRFETPDADLPPRSLDSIENISPCVPAKRAA